MRASGIYHRARAAPGPCSTGPARHSSLRTEECGRGASGPYPYCTLHAARARYSGDTAPLRSKVPGGKGPEGTVWKGDPMQQLGFISSHLDGHHAKV